MHRAMYGEKTWSFHALSRHAILPASPDVHQLSKLFPFLGGFMEASLHRHD